MVESIRSGDIGTVFQITIRESGVAKDVSAATTMELKFQTPDGTILVHDAVFASDGTNGIIEATGATGNFSQVGPWGIQAHLIFSSGDWYSSRGCFNVEGNV